MITKIIIVDDHTLVSNAIADLIDGMEGFAVTHQLQNGEELINLLTNASLVPDIVLLDINMPRMDGFATMEALKEKHPTLLVLALSMNDDEPSIIRMMRAGACGYITKQVSEDLLLHALQQVKQKGYFYTDMVMDLVVNDFQRKKAETITFTEREKEFLQYACSELTYKEIANQMHLSPKTIDGYREDLFLKFDVKSRVGLVLFALKHKLVSL